MRTIDYLLPPHVQDLREAIAYGRVSDPRQLQGTGIERQTGDKLTRYLAEWDLTLVGLYIDEGMSGFTGANVEFGVLGQILRMAGNRKLKPGQHVIFENADRISRLKFFEASDILRKIVSADVVIHIIDQNARITSANIDDLAFVIPWAVEATRGHNESKRKQENVLKAKDIDRQTILQGGVGKNRLPGWYDPIKDKNGKRIGMKVNRNRKALVRRIFKMAADGMGSHAIAQLLNRESIPAWGAERALVKRDTPSVWQQPVVSRLLRNRAVLGYFQPMKAAPKKAGKKYTPLVPIGRPVKYYEEIVTPALFQSVQIAITKRKRSGGNSTSSNTRNVLAGLLKCGHCSATMTLRTKRKNGKMQSFIRCSKRDAGLCAHPRAYDLPNVLNGVLRLIDEVSISDSHKGESLLKLENEIAEVRDAAARNREELAEWKAAERKTKTVIAEITRLDDEAEDQDRRIVELEADIESLRVGPTLEDRKRELQETLALIDLENSKPNSITVQARARLNTSLRDFIDRIDFIDPAILTGRNTPFPSKQAQIVIKDRPEERYILNGRGEFVRTFKPGDAPNLQSTRPGTFLTMADIVRRMGQ